MKKLAYVSGALFSSLFVLSMLFIRMQWFGAGPLLVLGLGGFALVFIPSFAKFMYDKEK